MIRVNFITQMHLIALNFLFNYMIHIFACNIIPIKNIISQSFSKIEFVVISVFLPFCCNIRPILLLIWVYRDWKKVIIISFLPFSNRNKNWIFSLKDDLKKNQNNKINNVILSEETNSYYILIAVTWNFMSSTKSLLLFIIVISDCVPKYI